jgi:hypothetical protein
LADVEKLTRISPEELDSLFDQARAEGWSRLTGIGPGLSLKGKTETWPESLQTAERVFQLTTSVSWLADKLRALTGLTSLTLWNNNIGDEGARAIAASLTSLTSLNLGGNNIGVEGVRTILNVLSLRTENYLRYLVLRDNGDLAGFLPKEVIETADWQAILAAYRRFSAAQETQTLRPLNELKLLVVGNEAVGKTSLLRYLIEGKARNPRETKTRGIVHHEKIMIQGWSPGNCQVQLNVWDFGGQEMMRGTHRFF